MKSSRKTLGINRKTDGARQMMIVMTMTMMGIKKMRITMNTPLNDI